MKRDVEIKNIRKHHLLISIYLHISLLTLILPKNLLTPRQRIKIWNLMALCAYCKDSVLEEESACFCPSCDASHHEECWEANSGVCSVFGCESKLEESVLLGCPYCEETYESEKRICDTCGEALMNPREFTDFLDRYQWEKLPSDREGNPVLAAGFLRNHGILARVSKKVPISMFQLSGGSSILVPAEQAEEAKELIKNQARRFRSCEGCGHILFIDEEECSFCSENSGADK